ncbi:MAG: GNAT family N-acetyltransferase [Rhodobacteraceae bacterium]|nr:GNAT family N-acetyltransferase [Paracoccaceae bacterium]
MTQKAGDEVSYTITYLEMAQKPSFPYPPMPTGGPTVLLAADNPPVRYFLNMYDAVGSEYEWSDQHEKPLLEVKEFLHDPSVTMFSLMRNGWPAGFFILDARVARECDLAYFGLVPEAVGLGLGKYLLHTAILMGWNLPNVTKLTVNTNSLDHPRALPLYQKAGFAPVRRAEHKRILTRDRTH